MTEISQPTTPWETRAREVLWKMYKLSTALFTLLLTCSMANAQQPIAVAPPPHAAKTTEQKLDAHLQAWEKAMRGVTNIRVNFDLTRIPNDVYKKERKYSGSALLMEPNFMMLRIDDSSNRHDYDAYIRNKTSLYVYSGLAKVVTEYKLQELDELLKSKPQIKNNALAFFLMGPKWWIANLQSDFLPGDGCFFMNFKERMTADDLKKRYEITFFKEDQTYIYLEFKPLQDADKQKFSLIRVALLGPKVKAPYIPYLPAQLLVSTASGDTERWDLHDHKINTPTISEKNFEYREIDGWRLKSISKMAR